MHRVILVNTQVSSCREHVSTVDRAVGEKYFAGLNLDYAGYSISEGDCRFAATWMVPEDKLPDVITLIRTTPIEGYVAKMNVQIRSDQPSKISLFIT